ncbi:acyl-CoA dehydrogenase family protein [Bradyrhizobium sp. LHD-71]|uniref:acyl-CoA dehydrogenase family protein n=1 Tax=Bradyrhizobium sp. LHD-71 TaxID=3072141 RepID=UPI00280E3158|nr:acyl-CoA dehydrogenase family protein [Bradyrhizobium sp. LHD-71]MDQ8728399.1 acyl-CoA dehydrogenase family protein [Bradyrhizobium sp. LHD-71]
MNTITPVDMTAAKPRTVLDVARELGPIFARRASEVSDEDQFVADNFTLLRSSGLVEAGVPQELGGSGASIDDLAAMLRMLARHCGSTALAFSMHTHQVAIPAWRWTHQKVAAVEPLLKRVAAERIVLLSSGGSDWIAGSGKAEKVDGGYRITARKIFSSGAPAGDLMMTGAVLEEGGKPPIVLHFGVPMNSPKVKVLDTWRTLGMRSTGSHDVMIDGHVVPDAAVALSRKAGEWHPLFQIIATIAFPLIYSVYLGVAEGARDIALDLGKQRQNQHTLELAGKMETELTAARLACDWMLDAIRKSAPSAATVNQVMTGKALVTRHAIAAVEHAMELAGGAGFYRAAGLERRFRDIQAARYHPLQSGPQAQYAGAMAMGLPVERIF